MKILVIGAGGVGGYFGGRLAQNDQDVTFLVRERRREQLRREGLRIDSVYGNTQLLVQAIQARDLKAEFDVVLLACKAYDLDASISTIAAGLAKGGAILPLLNGLAHIDLLNTRFGQANVLGGTAKIAATLTEEGVVKHLNDWNFITIGEQDGAISARVKAIAEAFPKTTVVAKAADNILQEMWEKIVHLSTAASMTCLMRASVGEIVRTPDGAALFQKMLALTANTASSQGFPPSDDFMTNYGKLFSDRASGYTTSMLRDIEGGKAIEADHIIGYMLTKAVESGLDAELLSVAYTHVKAYQNRRLVDA